jgi:hypothetical protein
MTDQTLWWIALGLGLVVAVVAVILLQLFLNQVRRIEEAAGEIWTAGKQVARNTATTWQLSAASNRLESLEEEVGRHADLLRRPGR